MTYYPITKESLEQTLSARINKAESELTALKAVTINTKHKSLTNRTIENGRIGDYIGIGKALYVDYWADHRYLTTDITAYVYTGEVDGYLRVSRTMTPTELRETLDDMITGREASLLELKADLTNAKQIITKYNTLAKQLDDLLDSVTWATRSVLK